MKANERRSKILSILLSGTTIHTTTLAKRLGVSERTIQLDLKELAKVYSIQSEKKGYYFLEKTPSYMNEEMIDIVKSLLYSLGVHTFPTFKSEIQHILQCRENYILFDTKAEVFKNIEEFKLLLQLLKWNYSMNIIYKKKKRTVHPLKIANMKGYWYLLGYELESEKIKSFLINRIEFIEPLLENMIGSKEREYEVRQLLAKGFSPWIKQDLKTVELLIFSPLSDAIKRNPPLNTELLEHTERFSKVKLYYFDEREALGFIACYMPYVYVEDADLREKFKQNLLKALQLCQKER